MDFPGKTRLNRIRRTLSPGCAVLYYHRIAESDEDPELLCVAPLLFREQMSALGREYEFLSLSQLTRIMESGTRLRRKCVAITFDDGYADNSDTALPILEEAGIPATFFVSSGILDGGREFWWDQLARALLSEHKVPQELVVKINGREIPFSMRTRSERQLWYRELTAFLRSMSGEKRNCFIDALSEWADMPRLPRMTHAPLSISQLRMLDSSRIADVGAHGLWHGSLGSMTFQEQQEDIVKGKKRLEEALGHKVEFFSYPFGQKKDFGEDTVQILGSCGFKVACTTASGIIRNGEYDSYRLPRVCVRAVAASELIADLACLWGS